ncbi:ESX secretion-associated protein EspG [Amycolatopsis thermophila]|uniref:EspG family protein n=1 Tax=Amycolatopsis thermophila TaxID=206084 RepID=A0ABU0ELG7_9PSEU|nr:ESX secretion-associated protein EspG [Amycolatopsis thermophila]MDQ0376129.1 hypothetical protein [Amycolatopsis thermophila]
MLSTHEFDLLWGDLGLPAMPYPLQVPSTGRTFAERALLTVEVYRELADRCPATGRRLDSRLEALLAGPEVSVDAVGHIGYPVRALAAADGRTGVLAVLAGGEVWLTGIPPSALVQRIMAVFPPGAAGVGPGSPGNRCGGGQIGVLNGGRPSTVVAWFDTPQGRYLLARRAGGVTLTPAEDSDLVRRVEDLVDRGAGKIHAVGM